MKKAAQENGTGLHGVAGTAARKNHTMNPPGMITAELFKGVGKLAATVGAGNLDLRLFGLIDGVI